MNLEEYKKNYLGTGLSQSYVLNWTPSQVVKRLETVIDKLDKVRDIVNEIRGTLASANDTYAWKHFIAAKEFEMRQLLGEGKPCDCKEGKR